MTVNSQVPINRHVGNGINTDFPYTFQILTNNDLLVYNNGEEQVEGADFSIVNQTTDGGTIRFFAAPFIGSVVIAVRTTPRSQTTDYDPYDPFPAETHEAALDKLTLIAQESFARAQFGLPLNVSGLFWDAQGLRIQNGADPISANHYATKRYVDENGGGGGPGGGFDPADDYNTTGNWINAGIWQWTGAMQRNGIEVATVAQIPDITVKADKSTQILSSDTETLTVSQPTLADDVTLTTRTNVADGLAKLGADGKLPVALLPGLGLVLLGGYDPLLGTPPVANAGEYYIFIGDGTITLKDADGVDQSVDALAGDRTIYLDTPVPGWYYVPKTNALVLAGDVFYDNTQVPASRQLSSENLQAAVDEILVEYARLGPAEAPSGAWNFTGVRPQHQGVDLATLNDTPDLSAYTQRAANENITGQWDFSVGISLVGSDWPASVGNSGQLLSTDGLGQLEWIDSSAAGMDPTQNYTISGSWQWVASLVLANDTSLQGKETGGTNRNLVRIATNNQIVFGNFSSPLTMRLDSIAVPQWYDGTNFIYLADRDWVTDNFTVDLSPYTQRNVNESISGAWTFTGIPAFVGASGGSALTISNNAYISAKNSVNGNTPILGLTSTNITAVGNLAYTTNLTNNGDLRLNNAQLNTANGLAKIGAGGVLPPSVLPFSTLEFIGTWDASGGTNPPDGPAAPTQGGQLYVINVAGTLTVFVDDSGTPVATAVDPGDYLVWISGANSSLTPGWYHVTREAPVFIDSANVTYDPATAPWTQTVVQEVLDEIGDRATLKDTDVTINASWTWNGNAGNIQLFPSNSATSGFKVSGLSIADLDTEPEAFFTQNYSGFIASGFQPLNLPPRGAGNYVSGLHIGHRAGGGGLYYWQIVNKSNNVPSAGSTESPRLQARYSADGVKSAWVDLLDTGTGVRTINGSWTFSASATFSGASFFNAQSTHSATMRLANDVAIVGFDFGGTTQNLLRVQTDDRVALCTTNLPTDLYGGGTINFYSGASAGFQACLMNETVNVRDRNGGFKKAGFRNPGERTLTTTGAFVQNDEGQVVRMQSPGGNVTVPVLEQYTTITFKNVSNVVVSLLASGTTIRWLKGDGTFPQGNVTIANGAIVTLHYTASTVVEIWGNGIASI